jgi:hypothetical protein
MGFSNHFNCAGNDSLGFDGMFDTQNVLLGVTNPYGYYITHTRFEVKAVKMKWAVGNGVILCDS